MGKTIDACGLSCPRPVLLILEGIKAGDDDEIVVLVDDEAAKENVFRAATGKGWTVAGIDEKSGVCRITIRKG